jgi:hypothetical protein
MNFFPEICYQPGAAAAPLVVRLSSAPYVSSFCGLSNHSLKAVEFARLRRV